MKNGLNTVPQIEVGSERDLVSTPTFMETVGASLAYKYDPIRDFAEETVRFGSAALPGAARPGLTGPQGPPLQWPR